MVGVGGHAFVTVSYGGGGGGGGHYVVSKVDEELPTKHMFGKNLIRPLRLINNDCSLIDRVTVSMTS